MMSPKKFQIIRPVHVHLKTDKVDLKKKTTVKKKIFCIFFQFTHQVSMKNGVECYKDFFGYFNALKTNCDRASRGVLITYARTYLAGT